ncbi:S-layer homology domain-containing protein [Paenibacillus cremeus]|uniref:S-layer homology domain-containing protein n=1 Tax=Paenibacillus cremeus TaxID=2163881 RepID=UPI0016488832|nr:S-layer homology domain-containing protein [Paenibacillus cremeus]
MIKRTSSICRILAMLLIVSVFFSLLPGPVTRAETRFSDVDGRYAWALRAISLMADKQVLTGYPDGRFRPDQPVNKSEWTVMVYRLFDKYRPNQTSDAQQRMAYFADVPAQHWAYQPISGIYTSDFRIGGYGVNRNGETAFRPEMQLTRLQLAQMLYAFFGNRLMDRRLSDNDACAVVSSFKDIPVKMFTDPAQYELAKADGRYTSSGLMDVESSDVFTLLALGSNGADCSLGDDELSNVQAKALASLSGSGIMTPNNDGYFRPKDAVTRAEAVTILERIYNYLKRNNWLYDYTSIDLNAAGSTASNPTGAGGAGTGSDAGGYPSTGTGGFSNNPDSDVIQPGSPEGNAADTTWSDKSTIRVRDYFDDKGVIVKDLRNYGELEAAVQPKGKKYLTVDLKSQEKVDLYIILDGRIAFVKQEELPLTLPVSTVSIVGLRSQQRNINPNAGGEMKATLSVKLLDEEPKKKK